MAHILGSNETASIEKESSENGLNGTESNEDCAPEYLRFRKIFKKIAPLVALQLRDYRNILPDADDSCLCMAIAMAMSKMTMNSLLSIKSEKGFDKQYMDCLLLSMIPLLSLCLDAKIDNKASKDVFATYFAHLSNGDAFKKTK